MIPFVASAIRRSGRLAIARPRTALWTTLALAATMFAAAASGVAATTIDRWTRDRPGSRASMVVYFDGDPATVGRADALVGELRGLPGVERAELVPAAESGRRLIAALGADAGLLDGINVATMPASVELTLAPGVRDVVAISPTLRSLRTAPGVVDVVVEDPGDDQIAARLDTIRVVAWSAAALFVGIAVITIVAATRVRLDRGRREHAVAELLGAGPSFVVVPSALAGAAQGLVAAIVAVAAIAVALAIYGGSIAELLDPRGSDVELAIPNALAIAAFIGVGSALGLIGGGLAGASRVAR